MSNKSYQTTWKNLERTKIKDIFKCQNRLLYGKNKKDKHELCITRESDCVCVKILGIKNEPIGMKNFSLFSVVYMN